MGSFSTAAGHRTYYLLFGFFVFNVVHWSLIIGFKLHPTYPFNSVAHSKSNVFVPLQCGWC